jgi:hypothetical protein
MNLPILTIPLDDNLASTLSIIVISSNTFHTPV